MPFRSKRWIRGENTSSEPVIDPGTLSPLVWIDTSDTSTLFQERTGASATTAIVSDNDPVGTIVNKGSLPLYFITDDDAHRAVWKSSFSNIGVGVLGTIGALLFDGVDDAYYATIADEADYDCISDGYSLLVVTKFLDNNAYQYAFMGSDRKEIYPAVSTYMAGYLCGDADAQSGMHWARFSDASSGFIYTSPLLPVGIDQYYDPNFANKNSQVRLLSWDRSTGAFIYRGSRSHNRSASGLTAATSTKYFYYGADWGTAPTLWDGNFTKGAVPEILLFPKLTQEQEYDVADYLVSKWSADTF